MHINQESVNKHSLFTQQVCAANNANIGGLAASDGRSITAIWEDLVMDYMTPIFPCEVSIKGVELFIKREDFLPFSFGGNKARIAEEFYFDMLSRGGNCMVGYGNPKSNLCRVLANMMQYHQTECHIIVPEEGNVSEKTNNSRIVEACQAFCHPCKKTNVAEKVQEVLDYCRTERGLNPYYIYGNKYGVGNEAVPVRAYVKVYEEIRKQERQTNLQFDYIFIATGTGMTQAGLLAGKCIHGGQEQIVGISVARKSADEIPVIEKYLQEYFRERSCDIRHSAKIELLDDYLCGGYGKYDEGIIETIRYMMVKNGVPLDVTYTGKGFYGMIDYIKNRGIKGKVLFIHTGGIPLFFDNMDIIKNENFRLK